MVNHCLLAEDREYEVMNATVAIKESSPVIGTLSHSARPKEIVSVSESGNWELCIPTGLKDHQAELERLLGKVFGNRPRSSDNLDLAKQMTINWCVSKARQTGLPLEDCLGELST